jgi:hypothetical protein
MTYTALTGVKTATTAEVAMDPYYLPRACTEAETDQVIIPAAIF